MDVRTIPRDPAEITRWHDAFARGWVHERPWEAAPPLQHYLTVFQADLTEAVQEGYAAYDGDEIVGAGSISIHLQSHVDKVEFLLAVPPEHRRRGVGRALVEHVLDRASTTDADFAITMTSYPFADRETHGFRRFAEGVGFRLDMDEVHRMLRLPVDADLLRKLGDEAAERHADYRIETWVDGVPDGYLDTFLDCYNLLSLEAPMGEVPWEASRHNRQSHHEEMKLMKDSGRTRYTTVAVSPDDEVVAYTELILRAEPSLKVSQWGTLVRPEHRGHRLGTAVKIANLAALQRDHPDRTEVHTTNAEVNAAMIGINEVLGFEAVAVQPSFYKRLR